MAPVVLCILDGWGYREDETANAPRLARTPNFDRIWTECPNAKLITHGPDVGLPRGQMGNSEVGHMNIGAGRVVAMDLGQIDLAIETGSYFEEPKLLDFAAKIKAAGGRAHLMGVVSDGGVHGHISHMIATANALVKLGLEVDIHAITDGRDVAPTSAGGFINELEAELVPGAQVASVIGRYYALDRDNRWERVQTAYDCMVNGKGLRSDTASDAVATAYASDLTDEFVLPTTILGRGIQNGDGLFCLNFRADRAREIMHAIGNPAFKDFDVSGRPQLSAILGMAEYSVAHRAFMETLFPKETIKNTLGEWVAKNNKKQFRLAETEKYPHVTFFLNGGKEDPENGEERNMPASPKVATYDMQPEMSSGEVSGQLVGAINEGFDLIVVNFANPDMVGHTGDLDAAIKACEAVDHGLGLALDALAGVGGKMIVTADHGNCEVMVDPETGGPHTAHTLNLVPVIYVGTQAGQTLRDGRLADLAPTLLAMMGLEKPSEMTGESLIIG